VTMKGWSLRLLGCCAHSLFSYLGKGRALIALPFSISARTSLGRNRG
jgi:hypothetical protein